MKKSLLAKLLMSGVVALLVSIPALACSLEPAGQSYSDTDFVDVETIHLLSKLYIEE